MAIITIQPNESTATNWSGLPATSSSLQWQNLSEGVAAADNDISYSNLVALADNFLTLNFEDPTLIADHKVLFVRLIFKWRPTGLSPTSLNVQFSIPPFVNINETIIITGLPTYFVYSCGSGICQTPSSESSRVAVKVEEIDAADFTVTFAGIDDGLRITAVELELGTGFVEEGIGGSVLGGIADLGPTRVSVGGIKVGGKITDNYTEQPIGGVVVAPLSTTKFIDLETVGGGVLMSGSGIDAFFTRPGFISKTFDISKDLILTYSGGLLNSSSNSSLGGEASPIIIEQGLNNLFDDISTNGAADGQVDYRCFYVFNDHEEETVFNIRTWINSEVEKGANVKLGIEARDELQSIILNTVPTSGFFTIRYEPSNPLGFAPVKVTVNSDLNIFAANFQSALRLNPDLKDVIVNASSFGSGILFEALFEELDGKRQQENLIIVENSLSPATVILIKKIVRGSPINSIAVEVNQDITPPGGVSFSTPTNAFPFVIPKLREGEGFHLWVERTITTDDEAIANDGFALGVSVEPVEPVAVA